MKVKVEAVIVDDRIHLYLDKNTPKEFFTFYIKTVKAISGRLFHSTPPKHWSIPMTYKEYVKECFNIESFNTNNAFTQEQIIVSEKFIDNMKAKPYNFQIVGINFLTEKKKCLLGDTMGLGKTVQILGAIYKLQYENKSNRALIIAPTSLKYQWVDEINKFLKDPVYIIIDKEPKKRQQSYELIEKENINIVVTSYELARIDIDYLLKINWNIIVLDECHKIKNHKTVLYKNIIKLNSEYKWAATGTPVQNRPDELFNIFSWIDPIILGNRWAFRRIYFEIGRKYGKDNMVLGYKNLEQLHRIIRPYFIRRLTKEVAPELPDLNIYNRYVEMTPDQERVHNIIREEAFELIKKTSEYNETSEVGDLIKKHPQTDLIKGLYTIMQVVADAPEMLKESDSKLALRFLSLFRDLSSPKIEELYDIVEEYLDEDPENKILIFSRFERVQRLIQAKLAPLSSISVINGQMSPSQKHSSLSVFKQSPNTRILIASDSMNYGANCQEASLVIQFDLPYNPAVYHQRNGRIHRIGTKHNILNVINLISLNSIDEKIYDILIKKETLSKKIIDASQKIEDVFDFETSVKLLGE